MTESNAFVPRCVVVTGGSRGIGRAIVEKLLATGHKVASLSPSGGAPEGALGIACNIADAAELDAAFAQVEAAYGPVEILVANAGITKDALILRMNEAEWDQVIELNLTGVWRCAKRASRSMLRKRWGRMIFIGSVVGLYGSAGQVNYSATKAGLVGMARSSYLVLRQAFRVMDAARDIDHRSTDTYAITADDVVAGYKAAIPAGRLGATQEVAATVAFLAGEDAGYISGAVIPVDGGLGMGH